MLKTLVKRIKKLLGLDEEVFHVDTEYWGPEQSHENWMNIYGDEGREDYDKFRD